MTIDIIQVRGTATVCIAIITFLAIRLRGLEVSDRGSQTSLVSDCYVIVCSVPAPKIEHALNPLVGPFELSQEVDWRRP